MKFVALIFLFLLSSCGEDFEQQYELGKLRVLAVVANTPEINAAATVTLTPLISYVDGAGATVNYSWVACPDPGIDLGADVSCDSAVSSLKLTGSGNFDTSTLAATSYTGVSANISINVPAAAFTYLATLDSDIQYNGLDYIVLITFTDPGNGTTTTALKSIKLSTKAGGELNTNPTVGNILFNSSTLSAFPTTKGNMTVDSLSAAETYDYKTSAGTETFTEEMYVSWYASKGEFVFNRTKNNEANPYTPEGTSGVFVIVYRDGRGGVAYTIDQP